MDAAGQPVSQAQPMQAVQVQYVDPNQPQQVVQQVQIVTLVPNPESVLINSFSTLRETLLGISVTKFHFSIVNPILIRIITLDSKYKIVDIIIT